MRRAESMKTRGKKHLLKTEAPYHNEKSTSCNDKKVNKTNKSPRETTYFVLSGILQESNKALAKLCLLEVQFKFSKEHPPATFLYWKALPGIQASVLILEEWLHPALALCTSPLLRMKFILFSSEVFFLVILFISLPYVVNKISWPNQRSI